MAIISRRRLFVDLSLRSFIFTSTQYSQNTKFRCACLHAIAIILLYIYIVGRSPFSLFNLILTFCYPSQASLAHPQSTSPRAHTHTHKPTNIIYCYYVFLVKCGNIITLIRKLILNADHIKEEREEKKMNDQHSKFIKY